MEFEDKLLKKIKSIRSYNKLYSLPMDMFHKANKKGLKPENVISKKVKILLLTSTCNGFGDVIFSYKLKQYLKDWYDDLVDVKIATNSVKQFTSIGEKLDELIHLKTKAKDFQCRKFNTMTPFNAYQFITNERLVPEDIESFDLYLVAPITADFKPDFKEIHTLVKNSNRFNTFFLTEYNSPIHKDIAFNVGVGKGRVGMFLIDKPEVKPSKLPNLDYPYSIIYIAKNDDYLEKCYEGFIELLTSKHKYPRLDIVTPDWMMEIVEKNIEYVLDSVDDHYSTIKCVYKKDGQTLEKVLAQDGDGRGELVFRFDVFPVPFDKVIALYQHSLPHVLLTGDQSITDFLSVRYKDSVPYYQGLPWKQNFYTTLAKVLPNKFFKSYKTSCGNIKAIKYNPDFSKFIKKYDFRVNAKPLMDAILMSVGYKSESYDNIKKIVAKSKDVRTVKKKLNM